MQHIRRFVQPTTIALIAAVGMSALAAGCATDEQAPPARAAAITMADLAFTPPEIALTRGERIELQFSNQGALEHDFTVDSMPLRDMRATGGASDGEHAGHDSADAALHLPLAPASDGTLAFEPTEAGRYEYYCAVDGHREAGMTGVIVVE